MVRRVGGFVDPHIAEASRDDPNEIRAEGRSRPVLLVMQADRRLVWTTMVGECPRIALRQCGRFHRRKQPGVVRFPRLEVEVTGENCSSRARHRLEGTIRRGAGPRDTRMCHGHTMQLAQAIDPRHDPLASTTVGLRSRWGVGPALAKPGNSS